MVRMETSKVPPPRSKMRTLHSAAPFFLSRPSPMSLSVSVKAT
jgi:hypothetical protein